MSALDIQTKYFFVLVLQMNIAPEVLLLLRDRTTKRCKMGSHTQIL